MWTKESLEFLKTADKEWFFSKYNGEVTDDNYLFDTEWKETAYLPSQNITSWYDLVLKYSLERYEKEKFDNVSNTTVDKINQIIPNN